MDHTRGLLRWLYARDPVRHVILMCAESQVPRAPRGTIAVRMPNCLAEVTIGLPAQLLASGVDRIGISSCEDARAHTATWEGLRGVERFEPPQRGKPPLEVRYGQAPLPRRVALGLPVSGPLNLNDDDVARTYAALKMLGAEDQLLRAGGDASVAAALRVEGCVACGVCVRACPNDALVLTHTDDESTLSHLRELCRGSLQCLTLCPAGAITSSGSVALADALTRPVNVLAQLSTAACERCGARHPAAGGALCEACAFRENNAFGSSLPPGVAEKLAAVRATAAGGTNAPDQGGNIVLGSQASGREVR